MIGVLYGAGAAAIAYGFAYLTKGGGGPVITKADKGQPININIKKPLPDPIVKPKPTTKPTPAPELPPVSSAPEIAPPEQPKPPTPPPPPADDDHELPTPAPSAPEVEPEPEQAPVSVTPSPAQSEPLPSKPEPVTDIVEPEADPEPPPAAPAPPPADVVSPVPTPQTEPQVSTQTPAGFDPSVARRLAPQVTANLQSKGIANYDRNLLRSFQRAAGVTVDGLYGGESRGALEAYGQKPPSAFFKPVAVVPYRWAALIAVTPSAPAQTLSPAPAQEPPATPPVAQVGPTPEDEPETPPQSELTPPIALPPPGFNPKTARTMAKQVANNIDGKKGNYSRDLLKSFQKAAGLDQDGIYGGGSRGALIFFGVPRPPVPLFKPTATQPYPWETEASV